MYPCSHSTVLADVYEDGAARWEGIHLLRGDFPDLARASRRRSAYDFGMGLIGSGWSTGWLACCGQGG